MLFSVFSATLACVLAVIADMLTARFCRARTRGYLSAFAAVLAGTPLALLLLNPSADIPTHLIALGFSLMGWAVYVNLAQALESSLRIRILRDIGAQGGFIAAQSLQEKYNDAILIGIRIQRLEDAGIIKRTGGRLHLISRKLDLPAKIFEILRLMLVGRRVL